MQESTRLWWETYRQEYDLCTSDLAILEAAAGDPIAADLRLRELIPLRQLEITPPIQALAAKLISDHSIPKSAEADALHVACAVVHRIDFLLTCNCAHINNPIVRSGIRKSCESAGYGCPEISSPLEWPLGGY